MWLLSACLRQDKLAGELRLQRIRQNTSAYASMHQQSSAFVSMRQGKLAGELRLQRIRQHTSAYVSIPAAPALARC
jgi:hypothetical protein